MSGTVKKHVKELPISLHIKKTCKKSGDLFMYLQKAFPPAVMAMHFRGGVTQNSVNQCI